VRILALHRTYERSCTACGETWLLSRRQAQFRPSPWAGGFNPGRAGGLGTESPLADSSMTAGSAAMEAELDVADSLRRCPACGSYRFSERPVTRRHPADPPKGTSRS